LRIRTDCKNIAYNGLNMNFKITIMKRTLGIICLIWAVVFGRLQTEYFGNNWLPKTNEEIMCDLTALLLCICGSVLIWQKRKRNRKWITLEKVNRVEVIDQNGRSYVNSKPTNKTELSLQDNGKTLKVFISN